jgi:hypothetical protein
MRTHIKLPLLFKKLSRKKIVMANQKLFFMNQQVSAPDIYSRPARPISKITG